MSDISRNNSKTLMNLHSLHESICPMESQYECHPVLYNISPA